MKITAHWHRPDCLRPPEPDREVGSNINRSGENPQTINLGFFKLKIHQKSAMQKSLVSQLNSPTSSSGPAGHNAPLVTRTKSKEEYFAEWYAWAQTGRALGENRMTAVDRMKAWVNDNRPDQPLRLSGLHLSSLPENLPANLHTLDICENQLTSLPENLPANLHTLEASYNQLTSLPEKLPANLHTLEAGYNHLTSLPEKLPANLHTLNISSSQLSSLPENLPANLSALNARSNRLTRLPENLPANLSFLNVRSNRLTNLPENLPGNLYTLSVDENELTSLPANLPTSLHNLYASSNQLTSLPENLPANLHTLEASSNQLTSLPENLPANLHTLEAGYNHLTSLPEKLPANLHTLNISSSQLSSLPENLPENLSFLNVRSNRLTNLPENLPGNLYTLSVDENELTSLPANLPTSLHNLYASSNQLTSLPENILTLPNTCTIRIDVSHLSEAVRNRLEAAMNAPDYDNVRIEFNMGGPRNEQARPLQEEVFAWSQEAGDTASIEWSAFQSEQYGTQFAQFLGRLRETSEYLNADTRPNFQQRIGSLLRQLQDDPESRGTCFNLAHDAVDTCGDRVALRMLNMETVCLDKRMQTDIDAGKFDRNPQSVVDYCKAQYRQQVLADAASAKIKTLNFCDEIEVILGYIVAFSREFKLNAQMDTLLYGACSNIAPEDVAETRKKLTNQAFTEETKVFYRPFFENFTHTNPVPIDRLNAFPVYQKEPSEIEQDNHCFHQFLMNSPTMRLFLMRKYPTEVASLQERIEKEIAQEQERLHERLTELDPDDAQYVQQCQSLQQEFGKVSDEANTRVKQTLLKRLCSENNVHANV